MLLSSGCLFSALSIQNQAVADHKADMEIAQPAVAQHHNVIFFQLFYIRPSAGITVLVRNQQISDPAGISSDG